MSNPIGIGWIDPRSYNTRAYIRPEQVAENPRVLQPAGVVGRRNAYARPEPVPVVGPLPGPVARQDAHPPADAVVPPAAAPRPDGPRRRGRPGKLPAAG